MHLLRLLYEVPGKSGLEEERQDLLALLKYVIWNRNNTCRLRSSSEHCSLLVFLVTTSYSLVRIVAASLYRWAQRTWSIFARWWQISCQAASLCSIQPAYWSRGLHIQACQQRNSDFVLMSDYTRNGLNPISTSADFPPNFKVNRCVQNESVGVHDASYGAVKGRSRS